MSLDTVTMATESTYSSDTETTECGFHPLSDKWTLYAHLPHDTDWSISSYKPILAMTNLEEAITLFESIPEKMTQNCMLFLMKNNIRPTWEDPENCNGGSYSFKVSIQNVHNCWKSLCYLMVGKSITNDNEFYDNINGITISPKRNFCIIKIWTRTSDYKQTDHNSNRYLTTKITALHHLPDLDTEGAQFKKHNPIT